MVVDTLDSSNRILSSENEDGYTDATFDLDIILPSFNNLHSIDIFRSTSITKPATDPHARLDRAPDHHRLDLQRLEAEHNRNDQDLAQA
jgi:hypothetical protein